MPHQKYPLDIITNRRSKSENLREKPSLGPSLREKNFFREHISSVECEPNKIGGLHRIPEGEKQMTPVEWWFTKGGNTHLMRKRSLEESITANNSRPQRPFNTPKTAGNDGQSSSSRSHSINRCMRHAHQSWSDSPCHSFPIFCSGIGNLEPDHPPEFCQSREAKQENEQGIEGNRQVEYLGLDRAPLQVPEDQGLSQLHDMTPKVKESWNDGKIGNSRHLGGNRRVQAWLERSLWRPLPGEHRTTSHQMFKCGNPTEPEFDMVLDARQMIIPEHTQGLTAMGPELEPTAVEHLLKDVDSVLEGLEKMERAISIHAGENDKVLRQHEFIERNFMSTQQREQADDDIFLVLTALQGMLKQIRAGMGLEIDNDTSTKLAADRLESN